MTLAEFALIAKLLRSKEPVKTAAMRVLVDGMRIVDVAEATGLSQNSISNCVQRFRYADAEIRRVYLPQNLIENNS